MVWKDGTGVLAVCLISLATSVIGYADAVVCDPRNKKYHMGEAQRMCFGDRAMEYVVG